MHKLNPLDIVTNRALREVILSIVEVNINECNNIELNHQIVEKVFSTFQRRVYFSKGIFIEINDKSIIIRISINVNLENLLLERLQLLQERIFDDIYEITGFKATSINLLVKNLNSDENKKDAI